jgi:flagellin-specific chaperone FliS|tara:strand:+ start:369 stop:593 length:225 start_codon:yes stop_codon:yes gene_type:complete
MQKQEIIKIIDNLKGRKNYEQKKAIKLGFSSLYAYFEDKLLREKNAAELKKKELEEVINTDKIDKNQKKSCSCC